MRTDGRQAPVPSQLFAGCLRKVRDELVRPSVTTPSVSIACLADGRGARAHEPERPEAFAIGIVTLSATDCVRTRPRRWRLSARSRRRAQRGDVSGAQRDGVDANGAGLIRPQPSYGFARPTAARGAAKSDDLAWSDKKLTSSKSSRRDGFTQARRDPRSALSRRPPRLTILLLPRCAPIVTP